MVIKFNQQHKGKRNPDGRLGGILIEAKDSQMYRNLYGLEIGETILETLKKHNISTIAEASKVCPIYLHSFDYGTVKYWAAHSELPNNYLLGFGDSFDLEDVNKYATGIGFQDSILWDYTKNSPRETLKQAQALGLMVHIWTFKDDVLLFNVKNNIDMYTIGQNQMKLDGVITEFCDVYAPVSQILRKQSQEEQERLILQKMNNKNLRQKDLLFNGSEQ